MSDIKNTDAVLQSLGLKQSQGNKGTGRLGQEQFLELMIAQLRNQDPFKPLESGDFLSQMAQFSTVTGISDLQSSFNQLAGSLTSNQALQASALVGRTVLVPAASGTLESGGAVTGSAELPATTQSLVVEVSDANGQLVRRMELGPQAAGRVPFLWDGTTDAGDPAAPGRYQIRARALVGDEAVAVDTLLADRVESVTLGRAGQGITLNLASAGSMEFSEVREIR